ncbi:MAG: PH domain-containing protein [Bacilli bacterium]|nr:PH domain-containing protein [Bacilli bacterium]
MDNKVYNLARRFQNKYFGTIAFRIRAHSNVVADHINKDEKVLYVFCGQKGGSNREIFSSCVVALTNQRIIIGTKRVLWGYFLTTITPDLFNDLKVQSGLLFGRILIDTAKEKVAISNLAKSSLKEVETAISTYISKYKTNKKSEKEESK